MPSCPRATSISSGSKTSRPYIGRKLECQITEIDRKGKSLVVSRRKILDRQREEMRQELKYSLAEGQTRLGVVRRLADFGAFVDIGGVDGLVHISDMSYGRLKHPSEVLKVGDEIEVQVLKIDLVKDRISLGMKQLASDPWNVRRGQLPGRQHGRRSRRQADGLRRVRRGGTRHRGIDSGQRDELDQTNSSSQGSNHGGASRSASPSWRSIRKNANSRSASRHSARIPGTDSSSATRSMRSSRAPSHA